MKVCSKCQVEKDEATDFHKDSRTGKARAWCRVCTNADNLARAKANPEKTAARSRAWRESNPERAAAVALARYHRDLVMAEYLGRPLLPTESVHHIDGNRQNNASGNLQLRIGQHGSHVCYRCADCGSARLRSVPIAEA